VTVLAERGGIRVSRVPGPFVLKQLADGDEAAAERLRAEAALLAAARGRGVIELLATTDDPLGFVMEYAPGGSLADRVRDEGALPPAEAVRIVAELADVLSRLHARGIVHRDVKPSNVLFTARGELRLADFGVAARIGSRGTLGDGWEELRVGTAPYAAPEQPAASAHPSADVYALGVVLYEMLTGRLPWEMRVDEDDDAFAQRIRAEAPIAPSAPIPPALEVVVMEALRPRPEHRPGSAAEFARRARRAVRGTVLRRGAVAAAVSIGLALMLMRIFALPT
jgi:serine/threonine-protein kinase